MTKEFSLIKQLNDPTPPKESPFPKGVQYVEKSIMVEGSTIDVFIPLRESDAFDTAISKHGKYIKNLELNDIIREFRGIRNRE